MTDRQPITFYTLFSTILVLSVAFAATSAQADNVAPPAPAPAPAVQPAIAQPAPAPATAVAPAPAAVQPTAAVAQPVAPAADPYGFTYWLNTVRAQYGLRPVGYDPNLTNWAAVNNQHQASRGMGHFVMGPARRQNSAMGNYAAIGAMWMASPAHQAALLDPTITYIGIAGYGAYWTFNAY